MSYVRQVSSEGAHVMPVLSTDVAEGAAPVLHVRGELDIATADQLRLALKRATHANPAVVVDLRDLTFIDVSGVRVLLEFAAARNGHGPLTLLNARRVAWLLDLLGIDARQASLEIRDGS